VTSVCTCAIFFHRHYYCNYLATSADHELRLNEMTSQVPRWTGCILVLFGYLCLLIGSASSMEILAPEDLASTSFDTPRLIWFGPEEWVFDVVAELALFNDSDVEQKIVLTRSEDQDYALIADLVDRKAAGVAVATGHSPLDIPGLYNYVRGLETFFDVSLPVVIVSQPNYDKLYGWIADEGRNITARILSTDVNPWDATMLSGAMIFYSVFMSAFTGTCLGLAIYKLIMFVRVKGCQESIPQTILVMEIVANTIRFIASVVDPLQSRAVLPYVVSQMLFTTSWPFVIINLLLVSFYWHELMTKTSMKINSFLSRLRIPFWCIFAVILALEIVASLLRALGLNLNTFRLVMGVCYIVIAVACCVFYAVTGLRLTKLMRKASKELMASSRVKRLTRTSKFIYSLIAGVVIWLIAVVIGGLTNTFWIPWGYFGVWFACFFGTTFISLMQILAIHEPRSLCSYIGTSTDMSRTGGSNATSYHGSMQITGQRQTPSYSSGGASSVRSDQD
jgi:hypothetical protein